MPLKKIFIINFAVFISDKSDNWIMDIFRGNPIPDHVSLEQNHLPGTITFPNICEN